METHSDSKATIVPSKTLLPPYAFDPDFFEQVRNAKANYRPLENTVIPPNNGKGFSVKKGQIFRIVQVEGPQVVDVALWNLNEPKEIFRPEHSFLIEGWFVGENTRLWSDVPYFRPMATCIEDTVDNQVGWHNHLVLGSHCTSEFLEMRSDRKGLNSCHVNFLQAIEPFGLSEENIQDNFCVCMPSRINDETGKMEITATKARAGDYVAFYAEIDLLVAVSVCPMGDGSFAATTPEKITVRPVGVEILDTGIEPREFPKRYDWRPHWRGSWEPGMGSGS